MTQLREIAHCRAGDKGNDAILAVVPYEGVVLDDLQRALPRELVAVHFDMDPDCVDMVASPSLNALVVTLHDRLGGGVTRSASIDPHGKTFSGHFLDLEVSWT